MAQGYIAKMRMLAVKEYESSIKIAEKTLQHYEKLKRALPLRRAGDKIEISLRQAGINITIHAKTIDSKLFWVTIEQITDILNYDLEKIQETRGTSWVCCHFRIDDVFIDFTYYASTECIPIKKTVTKEEIIGWRCS